ncbi:hypothetical protein BJV78DRAFT_1216408 [Lactifluus subvellereus]|nr:hypothetical protein BJV78DRAFT_1216408 [Lactifluus subvellereus]
MLYAWRAEGWTSESIVWWSQLDVMSQITHRSYSPMPQVPTMGGLPEQIPSYPLANSSTSRVPDTIERVAFPFCLVYASSPQLPALTNLLFIKAPKRCVVPRDLRVLAMSFW